MIIICPLHAVERLVAREGVDTVIGLLGPQTRHPELGLDETGRHLKLTIDDIAAPIDGMITPGSEHVGELIEFIGHWDRGAPMLIHCWAGISRSTAAAFTAMCVMHPQRPEADIARDLRQASPSATPNPLIVAHADALLNRNGAMIAAIKAMGRGAYAYEGNIARWPAD